MKIKLSFNDFIKSWNLTNQYKRENQGQFGFIKAWWFKKTKISKIKQWVNTASKMSFSDWLDLRMKRYDKKTGEYTPEYKAMIESNKQIIREARSK